MTPLRQRMLEDMGIRNFAENTQQSYLQQVSAYVTMLTVAYAAGLRVSEITHLKVTDVDSKRMVIRVDQGKGHKCSAEHLRHHVLAGLMLRQVRQARQARRELSVDVGLTAT